MKHALRWGYHPQYECEIISEMESDVQLDRHAGQTLMLRRDVYET